MTPPRKRLTQGEKRAQTRDRILDAATVVFAREGFHMASLEEIAEAAGYSKGALYYNFSDKAELFLALLEERVASHLDALRAAFEGAGGQAQQLQSIADDAMRAVQDENWRLLFFEAVTYGARNPAFARRLSQRVSGLRHAIAATVAAQTRGEKLSMTAEHVAFAAMALANGLAVDSLIDPDAVPPNLYADMLTHLSAALTGRQTSAAP